MRRCWVHTTRWVNLIRNVTYCKTTPCRQRRCLSLRNGQNDRDKGKITTEQLQDFTYIAHHYLPTAKKRRRLCYRIRLVIRLPLPDLRPALRYREQLIASTANEFNAMVRGLNGGTVLPARVEIRY